jgi:hypothetical protein
VPIPLGLKPYAARRRYTSDEPSAGDRTACLDSSGRDLLRQPGSGARRRPYGGCDGLDNCNCFTCSDGLGNCKRLSAGQPLIVTERCREPRRDCELPGQDQ